MTEPALRFLIVRLSSIGDIVHALPAAAALAESFPLARIHWVVEKRHALLLRGNPHLHRLIVLDTLAWRRQLTASSTWREFRQGIDDLRQCDYDAAVDFQGLWKSAVVARLSRARQRIGFAPRRIGEASATILYTRCITLPEGIHVVKENLALVEYLGARAGNWQFPLPRTDHDDAYVSAQLAARDAHDFIMINPGGGWRSKCWAPQNYAALIRLLAAARRDSIIVTGSPFEEPVIAGILQSAAAPRAYYFPTTLVQLISLARRARLFIAGDTGPLHIAAAVGAPVVGLYGSTDPVRNGPFAPDDIALFNPDPYSPLPCRSSPHYLSGISVEMVAAAVERRLARAHG